MAGQKLVQSRFESVVLGLQGSHALLLWGPLSSSWWGAAQRSPKSISAVRLVGVHGRCVLTRV